MTDNVHPDPGILLYTRIKKSPYYYGARRHGVKLYSVYNHHYHPRLYGDPIDEYWQLLEGVTVWDVGGAERTSRDNRAGRVCVHEPPDPPKSQSLRGGSVQIRVHHR